jgi:hypothetical protein
MGKFALFVVGPAGSGKSTFCHTLSEHYAVQGRAVHVCNFDPAAEDPLAYGKPSLDVRELITVEDAMEAENLGPNGGLCYSMEYLVKNIEWLNEQIEDYADDFLIIDMPGQIEVFTHIPILPALIGMFRGCSYNVATAFLVDSTTATADAGKFVSASLVALTVLMSNECPFLGILSKCDLLPPSVRNDEDAMETFEKCDFDMLDIGRLPPTWRRLTQTVSGVVKSFSMLNFHSMNITDDDSIFKIGTLVDEILQVAEDAEVRDRDQEFD